MDEITEIRDYHFVGDFAVYQRWWNDALPIIGQHMDVLGLWFDCGIPARISGSSPMDLPIGSANVTWIIRWPNMAEREAGWASLGADRSWVECAERHPGFEDYVHMSVRFLRPA